MSGSLGGGKSKSSSSSEGFQQSEQEALAIGLSQQDVAFEPFYQQLYGKAAGATDRAIGSNTLNEAARQLFTGGSEFLAGLNQDEGTDYLRSRLTGENPAVQMQIDQLQKDTGRLFREEFLPGITSDAVAGGTYGGGRQGVAESLAVREAGELFTRGATDIRARDVASRDAVASTIAQNTLQAANTGLGSLPMLLSVLEEGNTSEVDLLGRLSTILGGPTTLATSRNISQSRGSSYGEQSSRGKSSSFNFNTSFGLLGA